MFKDKIRKIWLRKEIPYREHLNENSSQFSQYEYYNTQPQYNSLHSFAPPPNVKQYAQVMMGSPFPSMNSGNQVHQLTGPTPPNYPPRPNLTELEDTEIPASRLNKSPSATNRAPVAISNRARRIPPKTEHPEAFVSGYSDVYLTRLPSIFTMFDEHPQGTSIESDKETKVDSSTAVRSRTENSNSQIEDNRKRSLAVLTSDSKGKGGQAGSDSDSDTGAESSQKSGPVENSSDTVLETINEELSQNDEETMEETLIPSAERKTKPIPPPSLVTPFGIPPTPGLGADNGPNLGFIDPEIDQEGDELSKKPTCSLNLVCYRCGGSGCVSRQILVVSKQRLAKETDSQSATYQAAVRKFSKDVDLISTDRKLFDTLRNTYRNRMCGFWKRYFSLKTLQRLRLLSFTSSSRPTPVPFDEFTMQEVLYAYNHPEEFGLDETAWVEWVFRLRQPDKRHALEFVEGWNGTRIAVVGMIPCIASTLVGVTWSAMGGDVQTAFTVAGFVLTIATVLLALLAVISGIES